MAKKYAWWLLGGATLWAAVFYYIGHVLLSWSLKGVALTYLNLMGWLMVAQFATYRCERISSYSGRIKRRMLIVGATALGIWIEIFAWLAAKHLMPWKLALVFFLCVLLFTLLVIWLSKHLLLRWRLGARPGDDLT
jgi:hypothetical protein